MANRAYFYASRRWRNYIHGAPQFESIRFLFGVGAEFIWHRLLTWSLEGRLIRPILG